MIVLKSKNVKIVDGFDFTQIDFDDDTSCYFDEDGNPYFIERGVTFMYRDGIYTVKHKTDFIIFKWH